MRVTAKADYAVRAAIELATVPEGSLKSEAIAEAQGIPSTCLVKILHELRLAGIVRSHRGPEGGHQLARPAAEISVADVLRAVEGPLAEVRGEPPNRCTTSAVPPRPYNGCGWRCAPTCAGCSRRSRWPIWPTGIYPKALTHRPTSATPGSLGSAR